MTPKSPTLASFREEQPQAVNVLQRLGPSSRRPHAIALTGPIAAGVTKLGRALVRALVCREPKTPFDACGHCHSCVQGDESASAQLFLLGEAERAPSVDDIRALEGRLSLRSQANEAKVVFLPDANRLRVPAQNALLKVLEEPPQDTTFILCAERYRALLPTIRSRLVNIALPMPPIQLVRDALTRGGIASELVPFLQPFCGTDVEAAKSLVDAGMPELLGELQRVLSLGTPSFETTRFAQKVGQKGPAHELVFGLLEVLMRDALAVRLGAKAALDAESQAHALFIEADASAIGAAIARLEEARSLEVFNPNRALLCETLLLTLNRREVAP